MDLGHVMLSELVPKLFDSYSIGSSLYVGKDHPDPDVVYGLYQCRRDVSLQVCSECIQAAIVEITMKCYHRKEAIIWYRECMLRFANRNILSLNETFPFAYTYKNRNHSESATNYREFHQALTLVQCTLDIDEVACDSCLRKAYAESKAWSNDSIGTAVFMPSCLLIYNIDRFYNDILPSSPQNKLRGNIGAILSASLAIGVIIILSATCFCMRRRKAKKRSEGISKDDMENMGNAESLQYDFNTIKGATDNFSEDNKLGRGGFGEVYKGKLADGQEIAVKRLSKYSEQGSLEFKNEVVLVAKLQHRNLVKLLGFCISAKEKILVYEFLPNSSLDRFLYDPLKRASLDWETRFKIINGIARGLLYLHEDSRLKIIHRDLKSSNVLLDQAMNAKISDFGLAKLFVLDETQGDTKRIVGTYGYMAPEYAIAGQFSVKSDVYSFGVIVLEMVSGQRNSFFDRQLHEEGLLHRAWRFWSDGAMLELVDHALKSVFSIEEVKMCIHIGLLCIQEDATKRPRMTSVIAALNGQSVTLPLPSAPHVFTISTVDTDATDSSYDAPPVKEDQQIQYHGNKYTGTLNVTELDPR
ncbi:cysteine-rich receptor-like protein kinase 44 [Beta vulgaris subsp. vulgaris]|uniref:cysteine-rich receptor-like protein kinase 44 n=1 Tax=Beta vulgaris subsp. vulgaris TaxID=3555 RepID=UPI002548B082|nr:cysteine-rich receptor-like protein kinase 44 [Beta vulgaris subsp. vulgaris]